LHAEFVFQGRINDVFQSAEFVIWTVTSGKQTGLNVETHLPNSWAGLLNGLCDAFSATQTSAKYIVRSVADHDKTVVGSQAFVASNEVPCNQVGFKGFKDTDCKNPPAPYSVPRMYLMYLHFDRFQFHAQRCLQRGMSFALWPVFMLKNARKK